MNSLDWNDLRYVTAVAHGKSAAGAARLLGVSNATVLRRLQALEQHIGTPLFYRLPTGYTPTDAGRQLAEMGTSIDSALTDVRRNIDGHSTELKGTVRFTTTDSLASALMPAILLGFRQRYPEIKVDMVVTSSRLDLDRRDADVALRPTVEPPESWVGTKLGNLPMGLYASAVYLEGRRGEDWRHFDWLLPGGSLSQRSPIQWLKSQVPEERCVMTVDSFATLRELVIAGVGATVLPDFAARDERLQLIQALPSHMTGAVWLLTHTNLRDAQRIKAFMRHVAAGVRETLQNGAPPPP